MPASNVMSEKNPFCLLGKAEDKKIVTDKAKQLLQKFIDDMIQLQKDNLHVGMRDTMAREATYHYVVKHCHRIAYPFISIADQEES
jgi:hypothetical protein